MAEIASAFVTIAPSAKGFGTKLNSEVGSSVKSSGSSLGKTFGKMFAAGAGIIAAAGIGNLLKGSIDEAREAQKVGAQTEAVLKSTGGAANISAAQIARLSTALSNKIGVDDEAIQSGANLLLTFTNVRNEAGKGNDIFTRATKTVQDMAAAFGGDATSNSKILGKALNDPVKGVSALTRVGVTFTDAQKEQIKTLVASGHTLKAQKIILGELSKETKGSALAQVTASDKASVALGNLKETIGTALLPVVDRLANTFTTKVAPAISKFVTEMQSGKGAGGQFVTVLKQVGSTLAAVAGFLNKHRTAVVAVVAVYAAVRVGLIAYNVVMAVSTVATFLLAGAKGVETIATVTNTGVTTTNTAAHTAGRIGLLAYAVVTKAVAAGQWLLNAALSANPIGLIIIGVAALVAGLILAYKHSETFRNAVDALGRGFKKVFNGIKVVVAAVVGFIRDHWRLLIVILGGPIGIAVALISKHWDKIKAGALAVIGWVKEHWPAIKAVIVGPFETAKTVIGAVWTALRQGASRVKEVVTRVFEAIQAAIQGAIDKAQALKDKLAEIAGGKGPIAHGNSQQLGQGSKRGVAGAVIGGTKDDIAASYGILQRVTAGAAKKADEASKNLKDKIAKIRDALANARSDFASLVEPISSNFTQGLFDFDTAGAFTANLATVKGTLSTLLANFTKLKSEGLSPAFLYQLFQSGGPGLINGLAALDAAGAQQAGSLFGDVMSLSNQLGTAAAGATDKGAALENQTVRLEKKLDHLIKAVHNSADRVGDKVNGAAGAGHRRGKHGGRVAA